MGRWERVRSDRWDRIGCEHDRLRLLWPRPLCCRRSVQRPDRAAALLGAASSHRHAGGTSRYPAGRRSRLFPRREPDRLRPHRYLHRQQRDDRRPRHGRCRSGGHAQLLLAGRALGDPELRMKRSVAMVLCAFAATGTACSTALTPLPRLNHHRTSPITSIGTHPTAKASFPSPAPGVDLHSATAVAIAEVEATWTVDTTVDAGWYVGELAASAYMTPTYAASIRHHPPTGAPGAMWEVWAAHQVTTTVSASIEADPGGPMDTVFTAYRKVVATVTPHGAVSVSSTVSVSYTHLTLPT